MIMWDITTGLPMLSLLVVFNLLVYSVSGNLELRDNKERELSSDVCIARRFCQLTNAAQSLVDHKNYTYEESEMFVSWLQNSNTTIWRSCSCSPACSYVGDCCEDAPALLKETPVIPEEDLICYSYRGYQLMLVKSCSSGWGVPAVEELCMTTSRNENAAGNIPEYSGPFVTSDKTMLTYTNVYCAICNLENVDDLETWPNNTNCQDSLINGTVQMKCTNVEAMPQRPPAGYDHLLSTYGFHTEVGMQHPCNVKSEIIDSCPEGFKDQDISEECTDGPADYVRIKHGRRYRNPACAECNGDRTENLVCQQCKKSRGPPRCEAGKYTDSGWMNGASFINLVSAEHLGAGCREDQYYLEVTKTCEYFCGIDTIYQNGNCFNQTHQPILDSTDMDECTDDSDDFITRVSQGKSPVLITNRKLHVLKSDNTSVCYYCSKDRGSISELNREDFIFTSDGQLKVQETLIPFELTATVGNKTYACKLRPTIDVWYGWISFSFCIVSLVFMILYAIVFCINPQMRNSSGKVVAGIMLMFALAYLSWLARLILIRGTPNRYVCYGLSIAVHYLFLAGFSFTTVFAFLMTRALDMKSTGKGGHKQQVIRAWISGLVLPLAGVVPAVVTDQLGAEINPAYGGQLCFMKNENGIKIFFYLPIALMLLINISLYISIIIKFYRIAEATKQVRGDHKEKIQVCCRLLMVFGFNWIFAILAAFIDHEVPKLLFVLTCTLHGFFGFFVFVFNQNNWKRFQKYTSSRRSAATTKTNMHRKSSNTIATSSMKVSHKLTGKFVPIPREERNGNAYSHS